MRSNSHHLHLFTLYRTLVLFVLFVCGLLLTLWTGNAFAQTQSYTLAFTQTRITAGESVTLTFATPATRSTLDWVGLYRPGDSDQNYRAWAYLPAGAQGTVSLSYAVPGTYEARLFLNNGYTRAVVTPTTLVITPRAEEGSFTLTTPAQHTAGQPITISWTAPVGRLSTRDWVGLYRQGDPDQNYRTFQYLPNPPATAGTLIFTLNEPGSYEARVFRSNSYTRVSGVTAPFTVTIPSGAYTLRFQETQIEPGATTRLTFTAPATRSTLDWVGLYRPGDSDQNYRAWAYLPAGAAGTVSFRVTQAGTYEARAFVNNGYGRVVTSTNELLVRAPSATSSAYRITAPGNIPAGASITVSWNAPTGANLTNDWIGLYRPESSDTQYISFRYIENTTTGSVVFPAQSPGAYEFRYFKNNSYVRVATSAPVRVSTSTAALCPIADLSAITNIPPRSGPFIAFGDSLTRGIGAPTGQDYVSQLSRKSGISVLNAGVSGDTTRDALARLERDVLAREPGVVIVWLGGNDILQRYYERLFQQADNPSLLEVVRIIILRITGKLPTPSGITEDETFANLKEVITRIHARGAAVIVIGFSGGVFDPGLENRFASVARETGALYVPNALNGIIGRPALMSDLVHPNATGYGIVADRVLPYLACTL